MTFSDSIRTCFAKWKTFDGRASRSEYWWFAAFVIGTGLLLSILDTAIFGTGHRDHNQTGPLGGVFNLIVFLPGLAVMVRRLHDSGRSGWLALLPAALSAATILFAFLGIFFGSLMIGPEGMGHGMNGMGGMGIFGILAMLFGGLWLLVLGVLMLAVIVVLIYWLTRPSQPETNLYGPPPAA